MARNRMEATLYAVSYEREDDMFVVKELASGSVVDCMCAEYGLVMDYASEKDISPFAAAIDLYEEGRVYGD